MDRRRVEALVGSAALFVISLYFMDTPAAVTLWAVVLAVVVASLYLYVPVVMHRTQWVGVDPDYQEIEPDAPDTPDAVRDEVRRTASQLESLGFVLRGHYEILGLSPGIFRTFFSCWEHPRSLDQARLVMMANAKQTVPTLAIQTEYQDGTLFTTAFTRVLPVAPTARTRPGSLAFPDVEEPRRLYQIHCARADPLGRSNVPIDDLIAYMRWAADQEHACWISRGYYFLDASGARLRPTWKGAYLMTWKLLPPFRKIRIALRRRKAARVLREWNLV